MRNISSRLVVIAAAFGLAACNATTIHKEDQQAQVKLEKRFITGSRIKQEYDPESERPMIGLNVRIIDRDEIDRSGSTDVSGALRKAIPN